MTKEQLDKAKKLNQEIENCVENIRKAEYTQSENIQTKTTFLRVNGLDSFIEVPDTLFRVIGKLILSEYNQKLIDLKKEFDRL